MSSTILFDLRPNHAPMQTIRGRMHASKLATGRSQLRYDFHPSAHSVICGRGRQNNHTGNRRFRILASVFVERYARADSKVTKAALVFEIITMIRQAGGNFCKYEQGAWYEVGDRCARGKVSAYFRDMLHTQYRSSAKSKTMRRTLLNRSKARLSQDDQQVVDGTGGHSDDASLSSSCSGSSTDSLGFETSHEIDFFDIEVF
jgi:hypothetical protein